jgi:hypothetical protein
VARRPLELSPEALSLIGQVSALENRLARGREEFAADLAGVRAEAEAEVARVERVTAERERRAEAAERALAEKRQRVALELDGIRLDGERAVRAKREEAEAEIGVARVKLNSDCDAFDAAVRGRRHELAQLVGAAWEEYERARAEREADELRHRDRPALKAAEAVQAKGRALAQARRAARRAGWVLAFYEQQFPWLAELRDLEAEEDYVAGEQLDLAATTAADEDDPSRRWLSAEEWKKLSPGARDQRALDRYLRSRKKPWQLGRDYERYIGYLREQDGFRVTYQGIFEGLDDLGRDLICTRGDLVEVVQCKRWAQHKTIHEKHIFQLFGTVVAARIEYPHAEVRGTFTTTTTLSDRAKRFAAELGIGVQEDRPLGAYPRIKCNYGRDGERIYHLPFDQQYDTTLIEPEKGEAWVATVAEAERLGFRRAWRWKGTTAGAA